jgi:chromosome segregation ATPase
MDKLDQILQVVGENQKTLASFGNRLTGIDDKLIGLDGRLSDFDGRFKDIDFRLGRLEENVVGINTRLVTVEERVEDMPHIKEVVDQTFGKIDDFMAVLNRYESEIAATRMKYERLENRVTKLESHSKV